MKRVAVVLLVLAAGIALFLTSLHIFSDTGDGIKASTAFGIPPQTVIAHRGASFLAPEETSPAYILARELNADYLEGDMQLTKDGVIVAFHDDTLERTTNVEKVFPNRQKNNIGTFTLSELKTLDAGSSFNGKFPDRARSSYAGQRILTLDEVITIAESGSNKPGLYLETKSPELSPGIEAKLVDLLSKRGWIGSKARKGSVVFQSFDIGSLEKLKMLAPAVPRVYLIDENMGKSKDWDSLVQLAASHSGTGPVGYIAFPWNIRKAHKKGLVVHVYTVNTPFQFRMASLFGADGLFTDRCDQLLTYYGRKHLQSSEILAHFGY